MRWRLFIVWRRRILVGRFVLQWHLSEICNLKCLHCYQENHKPITLPYKDLLNILEQYRELLKKLNVKGHINLTGGEPLCYPHLYDLLEEFKKDSDLYSFSILTNGTLINDDVAKKLASYNPEYIQVSLEGGKKINDYIRGKGVYEKVANAIKCLKKYNIFVSLSFTATKLNYKEFPKVVKYAAKYHVDNVWSDRLIPLGDTKLKEYQMNKEETNEYLKIMEEERIKLRKKKSNTNIAMYRALQFQMTNDYPYACSAGKDLLTVMENGDLVPCRRMPIYVGNLLKDNMWKLYKNNKILKDLRKDTTPDDCKNCEFSNRCRGGLKCLTYAIYNDLNHKDVGCIY